MNAILKDLLEFADRMGVVDSLNCYHNGFVTVDGKTRDGKKFSITLNFEEVTEDGN